ncbi:MAG: TIGR03759 family integrating conjugative element protein [Gammaproteobacteria bacterium]|nr:TIGR03759 family integrating conjugative element protein [Gammaproteobacteria bacterium]
MNRPFLLATVGTMLSLIASPSRAADPANTPSGNTTTSATLLERTPLTEHERARAGLWDLSAAEWQRYRTLMEGIRGSISPGTISPIEVLGIHARDEAERREYAERWAVMMREDAERILAFQRAYDEAGRLLFPNQTLIDVARLPAQTDGGEGLRRTDRVLLFARPDCAACDALLARVLARLDRLDGVDVFLSEIAVGDEGAIRNWAIERGIRPEWVTTRRVTLNFDGGALKRVAPGRGDLPLLMRRRGESVTPLSGSAL